MEYLVSLVDPWGTEWALTRGAPGRTGVYLMGPVGLQTPVEHTARSTSQQIGATPIGWAADQMKATWKLGFRGDDGDDLLKVWSKFFRGFGPFDACELRSTLREKGTLTCPVIRGSEDISPEKSPATIGLPSLQIDAPVISFQGCWHGETTTYTGTNQIVANPGDLPTWPLIQWKGSGAFVTAPGIGRVALPNTGTRLAELDTDPENASRVRVDGTDAPDLWRGMRGRLFPTPVERQSEAVWGFEKCTGLVTPRYTTMWRW